MLHIFSKQYRKCSSYYIGKKLWQIVRIHDRYFIYGLDVKDYQILKVIIPFQSEYLVCVVGKNLCLNAYYVPKHEMPHFYM